MNKYLSLLVLAILLAACQPAPATDTPSQNNPQVQAWVDAPLPSSVFPPGDIQVVAHASSPAKIAEVELSLQGGAVIASQSMPVITDTLVTTSFTWSVSQPGTYTLQVRALSTAGDWSGYAQTTIVISEDGSAPTDNTDPIATPTSTRVQDTKPVDAPTSTPTSRPLPPSTPTPTPGATFIAHRLSANQFYFSGTTCGSKEITFIVQTASYQVKNMELFYQFVDQVSGNAINWTSVMMQLQDNGIYTSTLNSDSIPGLQITSNYNVNYQYVAKGGNGQIIGQSDIYSDMVLLFCRR